MELIDKEELLRIIDRKIKYTQGDVAMDNPYNVRLNECLAFKHIILNCKCINAEPVKHGKWLLEREPDGKPYCYHCSVCDSDFHYIGIVVAYDYCPNCGAKI